MTTPNSPIQYRFPSLSDEQAERIGAIIAADFGLKRSTEYPNRYETENGTFTNKGVARRALRMIKENLEKR